MYPATPVPLTVTDADVVVAGGVDVNVIDGASGLTVAVKLELDELQKPDAGSCPRAVSVWFPSESTGNVAVQLPLPFAVAVAMSVTPS